MTTSKTPINPRKTKNKLMRTKSYLTSKKSDLKIKEYTKFAAKTKKSYIGQMKRRNSLDS